MLSHGRFEQNEVFSISAQGRGHKDADVRGYLNHTVPVRYTVLSSQKLDQF